MPPHRHERHRTVPDPKKALVSGRVRITQKKRSFQDHIWVCGPLLNFAAQNSPGTLFCVTKEGPGIYTLYIPRTHLTPMTIWPFPSRIGVKQALGIYGRHDSQADSSDPSMGGVWCSTHFQYRWRCQQDGVAHLCQQEAATKGKGKGKGEREEVLGMRTWR